MGLIPYSAPKTDLDGNARALPSASRLHLDYGRSLRTNLMAYDPFYTLNEIFSLSATSQKQFLNLISHKLDQSTGALDNDNFDGLPNLRYLKKVILEQIKQIEVARTSIQNAKPPKWPVAADTVEQRAKGLVEQDYEHLYNDAVALNIRCQESINNLMNSMAILESKKAIQQAGRVEKLTFLALFFVPLSFTTSFFGMNVAGLNNVPLWVWFITSAPIFGLTIFMFFCDVVKNWQWGTRVIKERLHKYIN